MWIHEGMFVVYLLKIYSKLKKKKNNNNNKNKTKTQVICLIPLRLDSHQLLAQSLQF
jgi:hypothetical protein